MSDSTPTIRSTQCALLVTEPGRCATCAKYRVTLNAMLSRHLSEPSTSSASPTNPSSSTNLRYLSTPQKTARFRRLRLKMKQTNSQLERLREKLDKVVDERSTEVDEDLNQYLVSSVEDLSPQVFKRSYSS